MTSKQVWEKIRKINRKPNNSYISFLKNSDKITLDPKKIANTFTNHFASISSSKNYSQDFIKYKIYTENDPLTYESGKTEHNNNPFSTVELDGVLSKKYISRSR